VNNFFTVWRGHLELLVFRGLVTIVEFFQVLIAQFKLMKSPTMNLVTIKMPQGLLVLHVRMVPRVPMDLTLVIQTLNIQEQLLSPK
jgi:hypothetical protein